MIGTTDEIRTRMEELRLASKPLDDFLYKYYHPHAYIVVTQGNVQVLEGDMSILIELRD